MLKMFTVFIYAITFNIKAMVRFYNRIISLLTLFNDFCSKFVWNKLLYREKGREQKKSLSLKCSLINALPQHFFTIRKTLIVSAFICEKCDCLHSSQLWDISSNVNCWRKFASLSLSRGIRRYWNFFHLRSFSRLENCEP